MKNKSSIDPNNDYANTHGAPAEAKRKPSIDTKDIDDGENISPDVRELVDKNFKKLLWHDEATPTALTGESRLKQVRDKARQQIEAHIAEHYVPKAEVRDDLEYTLAHFIPKARLQEALILVQALIQDAVTRARIKENHHWVDEYSRSIKALDGFTDKPEKDRLKQLRKLHQNRISALNTKGDFNA